MGNEYRLVSLILLTTGIIFCASMASSEPLGPITLPGQEKNFLLRNGMDIDSPLR
jgi:hypothetical protein